MPFSEAGGNGGVFIGVFAVDSDDLDDLSSPLEPCGKTKSSKLFTSRQSMGVNVPSLFDDKTKRTLLLQNRHIHSALLYYLNINVC